MELSLGSLDVGTEVKWEVLWTGKEVAEKVAMMEHCLLKMGTHQREK